MAASGHIIRSQVLEVVTPDQSEVPSQDSILEMFYRNLVPVMERILDKWDVPGAHIRIDKLELDLGRLHPDELEDEWQIAFEEVLEEALAKEIGALPTSRSATGISLVPGEVSPADIQQEVLLHYLQTGALPWWTANPRDWKFENAVAGFLTEMSRFSGHAPRNDWWEVLRKPVARIRVIRQLPGELRASLLRWLAPGTFDRIEPIRRDLIRLIEAVVQSGEAIGTHLPRGGADWDFWSQDIWLAEISRHPNRTPGENPAQIANFFLRKLLPAEVAGPAEWMHELVSMVQEGKQDFKSISGVLDQVRENFPEWEFLSDKEEKPSTRHSKRTGKHSGPNPFDLNSASEVEKEDLINPAEKKNMANEQESTENKKNHAQPGTERSKSKGKGKKLDIWGNKGKSGKGEAQSASDKENIRSQKGPENEGVEHKSSIRERFKTWKENLGDETASSEAKDLHALGSEKEGIFVETAGLVLLNPYMKPFFAHLGLLETDYQFKSKRDQVHAVYLLHYLATGSPEVPQEPELVFAKILTGLPWSQPLDLISMPTATEREEADSMLETVINYWTAVGNIKPQTLRKQFLDRPGKITRDPNGWLLQVEEAAYDILLDRLPWNIGMIRLPWLEDMIHVRWRN